MAELTNYKAKHKSIVLDVEQESAGEDHKPTFTTIYKLSGKEYARATDIKKKGADEKAAQEALNRLYNENPQLVAASTSSYLASFESYLAKHGLENRIGMEYVKTGPEHEPTWTCTLFRDGEEFSNGTAARKRDATEVAVRNAALLWNTTR